MPRFGSKFSHGLIFAAVLVALLGSSSLASAQQPKPPAPKRPLEHKDYDLWNRLGSPTLSRDGKVAMWSIVPADGDAKVIVRMLETGQEFTIERASRPQLTYDGSHVCYLVPPTEEELKKAREAKKKPDEMPKSRFEMLDLSNGKTKSIDRVKSFRLPEKNGEWLAVHLEKPLDESAAKETAKAKSKPRPPRPKEEEAGAEETEAKEAKSAGEKEGESGEKKEPKKKKEKAPGTTLVVMQLSNGLEVRFPNVTSYNFNEEGSRLAWSASAEKEEQDGVFVINFPNISPVQIVSGRGHYNTLVFDEKGKQLAFTSDRDDYEAEKPWQAVYLWIAGKAEATQVISKETEGIPEGWEIVNGRVSFSENGRRLFVYTKPRPEEPKKDDEEDQDKDEEDDQSKVKVDIWHWQDPYIQPMQLRQANGEKNRSYQAMFEINSKKLLQLETEEHPSVSVGDEQNADVAIANVDEPYRQLVSWDSPGYSDVYLIDLKSNKRELILQGVQSRVSLSPKAKYLTWWDTKALQWMGMSIADREPIVLSEKIPYPVHNELHDTPSPARGYGTAGWLENDRALLIYDAYDIWYVDPRGRQKPRCITEEQGRQTETRFRYTRTDREEDFISDSDPLLLSAFHTKKKSSGFYQDQVKGEEPPTELLMLDESIRFSQKAEEADTVIVTRSTFQKYADVWLTDMTFEPMKQLSDANPQQAKFTWGSAELYEWTSLDGEELQGILYKPDGFDPAQQYPMLVYFYERSSDGLHRYVTPAPARASINYSFYVSRGYLVFVPDIPYRTGHPGQSCVNAVMPGVTSLIEEGFVKRDAIGVQGHSWGGYQTAFLVTRCNLFACAESGAPVSNMTSAYGGIRWSSGMSRMFQYERTQSRIGETLWDAQQKYIENSPLFNLDQVETPLLILHNDEDGAVPWYQGIELFVGLRRLGKPAWLFNYNGEDHGLRQEHNQKDWSIRMQQFFDHYCKDAPAPVWLKEGVPAVKKGETWGLELIEEEEK